MLAVVATRGRKKAFEGETSNNFCETVDGRLRPMNLCQSWRPIRCNPSVFRFQLSLTLAAFFRIFCNISNACKASMRVHLWICHGGVQRSRGSTILRSGGRQSLPFLNGRI